jgi:hypothetical protein
MARFEMAAAHLRNVDASRKLLLRQPPAFDATFEAFRETAFATALRSERRSRQTNADGVDVADSLPALASQ